jgi:hypothetical protein
MDGVGGRGRSGLHTSGRYKVLPDVVKVHCTLQFTLRSFFRFSSFKLV